MTSQWLTRFTTDLKEWVDDSPSRKPALCNIVGTKFSKAGSNPAYRDHQLAEFLTKKTGYITSASLYNVIHAGKQVSGGLIDTHIALYYLAKVDETYSSYVDDIEKELFGKGRTFFDVFGWCPRIELAQSSIATAPLTPDAAAAALSSTVTVSSAVVSPAAGLNCGPQLRLSPPGFHDHPSHFSHRAIKEIIGREAEKALLREFVKPNRGFRWLQLAGTGGQGKSRMAFDLMHHVGDKWIKGFLTKSDLDEFQGAKGDCKPDNWRNWHPVKPHLIIIDYVIGRESEIGYAMDLMADRQKQDGFIVPICVLLIERQRWDRGGLKLSSADNHDADDDLFSASEGTADWFRKLHIRGSNERSRNQLASTELRFDTGVIELGTLSSDHLREIVISLLPKHYRGPMPSTDDIQKSLYRIDKRGSPLFAYFLSQAMASGTFRPNWEKTTLLQYVFSQHCLKRWNHSVNTDETWGKCPKLSDNHPALWLALLATIVRYIDCRKLMGDARWEPITELIRKQTLALADGPIDGGPGSVGNIIPALEPDILGEWFVLTAFDENPTLSWLMDRACKLNPDRVVDFIVRAVQDFPNHHVISEIIKFQPEKGAARSGFAGAMVLLGFAYHKGEGVDRNAKLAVDLYRKAAEQGNASGMLNLAICYHNGDGIKKNPALAFKWYSQAADAHEVAAMVSLALCYHEGFAVAENPAQALIWFRKAACLGDSTAMFNLAICYEMGRGTEIDKTKAAEWYQKGAQAGNSRAMFNLALCYHRGDGVVESPALAAMWYGKAAEMGHVKAMVNYAICFDKGYGVEKNYEKSKLWYNRAIEAGYKRPT